MTSVRPKLRSLTDIYTYLRNNPTPIYFVTPCPYNLLGIDHWIGNFEYISYFDTFDGFHPRVFTPKGTAPREVSSCAGGGAFADCLSHGFPVPFVDRAARETVGGRVAAVWSGGCP